MCQLAPALLGINLSPYLSLLGEATGLIGLKLKGCRTTNKCQLVYMSLHSNKQMNTIELLH